MSKLKHRLWAAGIALSVGMASAASASSVSVSITNEQGEGGLFLTPLVSIFHDGSFDTFSPGELASSGVEAVAETGNGAMVVGAAQAAGFDAAPILSPGGFPGAPVIDPGETASRTFNLSSKDNRYFSFLSMVIPSNDLFIGNGDPTAYEVFDAAGAFTDIGTIYVYTSNIYDAGTEANDNQGAAFNAAMGDATDTKENIGLVGDISFLIGQETVAGTKIDLPKDKTLLATIRISEVPLPAGFPLLLGGLGILALTRRKKA